MSTRPAVVLLLLVAAVAGCTKTVPRGKIVFQSNRDGNFQIYSMNDDGTSLKRLTNSPSYDVSPSWSPDAKRIVFASDRGGNWDIYTMSSDGEDVKRLTSPPGSNSAPSWAKGGTKILFVSTRDVVNGDLYLMNPDGAAIERLTQDSTVKDSPVMTPDGRSVFFGIDGRDGSSIAMLDISSKSVTVIIPPSYNALSPRISPDGSLLLFAATRNGQSSIYTSAISGTNVKMLHSSADNCRTPAWRGSEREIVYSKNWGLFAFSLDTNTEVALSSKGDSAPHWISE